MEVALEANPFLNMGQTSTSCRHFNCFNFSQLVIFRYCSNCHLDVFDPIGPVENAPTHLFSEYNTLGVLAANDFITVLTYTCLELVKAFFVLVSLNGN